MRWLTLLLLLFLVLLQYRLWFAEGSLAELHRLESELVRQDTVNLELRARNRELEAEVIELQRGTEALEEKARNELGMVKKGETLYVVTDKEDGKAR